MSTIGERITGARVYAKLSRAQLAKRIKKSRAIVYSWEDGRNDPRIDTCKDIARVCGVRAEWLILGAGDMITTDPDAGAIAS